jgi:ribosomal protein L20A (L18A)
MIKRSNIRIHGVEEVAEIQTKGIENLIQQNHSRKFPKSV